MKHVEMPSCAMVKLQYSAIQGLEKTLENLQDPVQALQAHASIARRLRAQLRIGPARGSGRGQTFAKNLERHAAAQHLAETVIQTVLHLPHFFRRDSGLAKVLAHQATGDLVRAALPGVARHNPAPGPAEISRWPASSLPLSAVRVCDRFQCAPMRRSRVSVMGASALLARGSRIACFDIRSTEESRDPRCISLMIKSSSQSPMRLFSSASAERSAMSTRSGMWSGRNAGQSGFFPRRRRHGYRSPPVSRLIVAALRPRYRAISRIESPLDNRALIWHRSP